MAVALQDWTRQCDFIKPGFNNSNAQVNLSVTTLSYVLVKDAKLQELGLDNVKVYIDNTPFPDGVIKSMNR
jgi:hypothetical protein